MDFLSKLTISDQMAASPRPLIAGTTGRTRAGFSHQVQVRASLWRMRFRFNFANPSTVTVFLANGDGIVVDGSAVDHSFDPTLDEAQEPVGFLVDPVDMRILGFRAWMEAGTAPGNLIRFRLDNYNEDSFPVQGTLRPQESMGRNYPAPGLATVGPEHFVFQSFAGGGQDAEFSPWINLALAYTAELADDDSGSGSPSPVE